MPRLFDGPSSVPGAGPHVVTLTSGRLDEVVRTTTIDGFTQTGAVRGDLAAGTPHTLMLADNPEDGVGDFPADSDALAVLLPRPPQKIYLSEVDILTARAQLMAALTSGVGWVNYLGRGDSPYC